MENSRGHKIMQIILEGQRVFTELSENLFLSFKDIL